MSKRTVWGYCRLAAVFLMLTTLDSMVGSTRAEDILIRIVGNGGGAKYVGPGDSDQRPVHVKIDDSIIWRNDGNRTHTATAETTTGEALFNTPDIGPAGAGSAPQIITRRIYELAGGQPGGSIEIAYFCEHHSAMKSSLIVSDTNTDLNRNTTRLRRDITKLLPDELNAYRDAWRQAQTNRQYLVVSGHHNCPDRWCHRDSMATFLPWHREYVLRMEAVIGQPIHYWDWTSDQAATSGIPRAFTDRTYRSADGRTYSNPLYSFRFSCNGPTQSTARTPGANSSLRGFARAVQSAYGRSSHFDFSSSLDRPHGSIHTWVGGQMFNTTYASYDPIFWAHHSNVDRQWASWQKAGGANPTSAEGVLTLRGFGMAVRDRLDIAVLGYAYDRYDAMPPTPTFMQAPPEMIAMQNLDAATTQGVGKTFNVAASMLEDVAGKASADQSNGDPLVLMAQGIPDHPAESLSVFVFLNQPDAVPADATDDNPHFVGEFGIFGGAADAGNVAEHAESRVREVLELVGDETGKLDKPIRTVTLVATNEAGAVVSTEKIPVTAVKLEPAATSGPGKRPSQEFIGLSANESFDEAYRNAVNQAQARLGSGDRLIGTQVVSTEGERGGITGKRQLRVKIRAWVK